MKLAIAFPGLTGYADIVVHARLDSEQDVFRDPAYEAVNGDKSLFGLRTVQFAADRGLHLTESR